MNPARYDRRPLIAQSSRHTACRSGCSRDSAKHGILLPVDTLNALLPSLVLLAIIAAIAFLARRMRISELRKSSLSEKEVEQATIDLLDYVKKKSYNPETEVALRPFWRGRKYPEGDKALVLYPLLSTEILLEMRRTSGGIIDDLTKRGTDWAFLPLPDRVVLNPQEWHRMVRGEQTVTVIERQYNDRRRIRQDIRGGSGPISVGSLQAGDLASTHTGNIDAVRNGLSSSDIVALANALRADAEQLPTAQADLLSELAKSCEEAAAKPSPSDFGELLQSATKYATLLSGGMEATTKLISEFHKVF
jgi:hypothetical protein